MPLWGRIESASGNQKPLFANTSNGYSNSTINGATANGYGGYGNMIGVSATEKANATGDGPKTTHAGWVSQKIGTGPIVGFNITSRGASLNTSGFLIITDTSPLGQGVANIAYSIANTQNLLQVSANATLNGVNTLTVVSSSGWSNATSFTVKVSDPANTAQPVITSLILGGRAGRVSYETIVAMGTITGDDSRDDSYFPGV